MSETFARRSLITEKNDDGENDIEEELPSDRDVIRHSPEDGFSERQQKHFP